MPGVCVSGYVIDLKTKTNLLVLTEVCPRLMGEEQPREAKST